MILRNTEYTSLAEKVLKEKKKIVVYGAGMIGQIVIPYLIDKYRLSKYLDCFVDADERKAESVITIGDRDFKIKTLNYLKTIKDDYVLLIANSKPSPIVHFLDGLENLSNTEGYIVPMMQIYEANRPKDILIKPLSESQLIPKRIHYCWFGGGTIPPFLNDCIESWKIHCPDYDICEWNENNYDVGRHEYTWEAYKHNKYGFVSDLARLDVLYENGGVYLDTDVTLIRNIDALLYQSGFVGVEKWGNINTGGGCGFVKGHPMLKKMIDYRDRFHFELSDGSLNVETNGVYETRPFLDAGFKPCNELQIIENVTVYPAYVNHPYDYMSCEMNKRKSTVSVHHFYGGWMAEDERTDRKATQENYAKILARITLGV